MSCVRKMCRYSKLKTDKILFENQRKKKADKFEFLFLKYMCSGFAENSKKIGLNSCSTSFWKTKFVWIPVEWVESLRVVWFPSLGQAGGRMQESNGRILPRSCQIRGLRENHKWKASSVCSFSVLSLCNNNREYDYRVQLKSTKKVKWNSS